MDLKVIVMFISFGVVIFGFLMMFYCMDRIKHKDDKGFKSH